MSLPSLPGSLPNAIPIHLRLVTVLAVAVSSPWEVSSSVPVFTLILPPCPGCLSHHWADAWPPLFACSGGFFAAAIMSVISLRVDALLLYFCCLGWMLFDLCCLETIVNLDDVLSFSKFRCLSMPRVGVLECVSSRVVLADLVLIAFGY